jgi:hypothetical protein
LAKSSCGSSPFWLQEKIAKKKNTDWVIMSVGGFLRKDPINPSLLPKEYTHEMQKKKKKKHQRKDTKQLILGPTPLIQIPCLDCTIVDQCSTFLLFFNQKIWWTIFEGGEYSLGLTGIRSCAIQQANPTKICSWV